jgi:hypothetical protein
VALDGHKQVDVAGACSVTPQAVFNWLKKEKYHPNDKNAGVLLALAWDVDKKRVRNILRAETKRYSSELKRAGIAF